MYHYQSQDVWEQILHAKLEYWAIITLWVTEERNITLYNRVAKYIIIL